MKNYLYIYHSDIKTAPSQESLDAWNKWFETLGENVVDSGNPVAPGESNKAVYKDGTSKHENDTVVGYSIVKAENLDAALKMVAACPLSDAPGCEVRVYETSAM